MSFRVEILPQALSDIKDAFRWIANNIGATVAETWYEDLLEAIRSLESFPKRCAIRDSTTVVWKSSKISSFVFIEVDYVFILHVRHSSRALLAQDPEDH
jgi:plasmid stabilization system protein ParE